MVPFLTEFSLGRAGGDLLLHAVRDHGAGGSWGAVDQHHPRSVAGIPGISEKEGEPACNTRIP